MNTKTEIAKNELNVLLVGNNPIDMGKILEKLHQIRGIRIITEIAFDVKSLLERLTSFKPNFIFIDDNIGKSELELTVQTLAEKNATRNIPITVLKNSNYQESIASKTILDYLLKNNLSPDRLYNTLKNALRFRRTQIFLQKAYRKRKQAFREMFKN